jgi:hypothetical protein
MAEKDIIQNMILQLGQSQDERLAKELNVHFADVDERQTEELLLLTRNLAPLVKHYRKTIADPDDVGDWTNFFPADADAVKALLESGKARVPAHLALFLTFLELYRKPQGIINGITGRHLDFHYRDILRLARKPAVPDKAHLVLELKKSSPATSISVGNVFSAGKDKSGVELIYAPTGETVLNTSSVTSLRSVFVDGSGHGTVRFAPVAN